MQKQKDFDKDACNVYIIYLIMYMNTTFFSLGTLIYKRKENLKYSLIRKKLFL